MNSRTIKITIPSPTDLVAARDAKRKKEEMDYIVAEITSAVNNYRTEVQFECRISAWAEEELTKSGYKINKFEIAKDWQTVKITSVSW